jgi:hypothetical protein
MPSLKLFLGIISFFIALGIVTIFICGLLGGFNSPNPYLNMTFAKVFYKSAYSFIDGTIAVAIIILLFVDVIASYYRPSRVIAIMDLIILFVIGYISIGATQLLSGIISASPANTITHYLPFTSSFFTGGAFTFIFAVCLVISIIFNVRNPTT